MATRQLLAAGIGYDTVRRLAGRGRLIRLHHGVYAVGHLAPTEYGEETAALLAVGDRGVLASHSAALLWNLRTVSDGLIHIVMSGRAARAPRGVRVHSSRILDARDARIRNALPVTSLARTLLDLTETLSSRQLELAFDQALIQGMSLTDVAELLHRVQTRTGAPRLRALLERERGSSITRSVAEERFLHLVRQAELPEPEINARIHGYEVDFYWREHGVVVEIDGFRYHSTARAFEHDRRKQADLSAHGLETLRFSASSVQRRQLATVARLAAGFARHARPADPN